MRTCKSSKKSSHRNTKNSDRFTSSVCWLLSRRDKRDGRTDKHCCKSPFILTSILLSLVQDSYVATCTCPVDISLYDAIKWRNSVGAGPGPGTGWARGADWSCDSSVISNSRDRAHRWLAKRKIIILLLLLALAYYLASIIINYVGDRTDINVINLY